MPETRRRRSQPESRWMSIADAATYLGLSERTVRRYIEFGQLPAYRAGKRLVKVQQSDLDAFMRRIPTVGQ